MGTTRGPTTYRDRANLRVPHRQGRFRGTTTPSGAARPTGRPPENDPYGVTGRESRDSDAHPESHAVGVLFDVTASMQNVRAFAANLPKLMDCWSKGLP